MVTKDHDAVDSDARMIRDEVPAGVEEAVATLWQLRSVTRARGTCQPAAEGWDRPMGDTVNSRAVGTYVS